MKLSFPSDICPLCKFPIFQSKSGYYCSAFDDYFKSHYCLTGNRLCFVDIFPYQLSYDLIYHSLKVFSISSTITTMLIELPFYSLDYLDPCIKDKIEGLLLFQ